ncbi:MAG: aminotransferase class I/II-fold pyridoxal phosphate-dependent enzyme [Lachnospiraceae bacterium]|nr:aminotransferase class I/II-fold pyridoxal phosphate-dependent enzyme [Lachnospiraceae bacterium]
MEIAKLKERVWLASPTMHKEEQAFIKEAFDTNWVSTVGEHIEKLEEEISQYIGCQYAVALSSGTAALHLAVKMAGIGEGDLVFCSNMTFAATVNPVSYEKGRQIFIDSEYDTWNMDPLALEQACKSYPEAKAVVVAHLYGTPAKLEEIQKICKKYHLILIEDAAESLGATYQGKQTGSFGEYSVVSFNGNKIITTSGGGMLLTDRKEAAEKVRFWSTQAREKVAWYEHKEIGYNYRLSNVLAGVGRGQFGHLEEHKELKKKIYKRYEKGLEGLPVKMNPYLPESEPNFWLSCLLIEEGSKVTPGEIQEKLEEYNIESRPIWKPMHLQPLYRENLFIKREEGKEVGTDIFKRGLCLPSDIKMTEETQEIVIELIKRCF